MRKFLCMLLVICIISTVFMTMPAAAASSGTCPYDLTWEFDDINGALFIFGNGKMYDYLNVEDVPWYSFRKSIKEICIYSEEISIGSKAFYGCSNLVRVSMPGVTEIGSRAFEGCLSLIDVEIPSSLTSIGVGAFSDCVSLTRIRIPKSVTHIGGNPFPYCSNLTEIYLDERNENFCIVDGVLFNKEKTVLISYPCGKKTTTYAVPSSVTRIFGGAFYGCNNLQSVRIPDGVTSIGGSAFYHCRNLTSITIPSSVASIGGYAFYYCRSLTSVTIPDSVKSIGYSAFSDCSSLTDVYYSGSEDEWNDVSIDEGNACLTNATIHYNSFGKDKPRVTQIYIMTTSPRNNETEVPCALDLEIYFNTTANIRKGKIYIKEYKTDKTVKTIDISECVHTAGSNTIGITDVNLDAGKTYYVTMDSGTVTGDDGILFYGISSKDVWTFSTEKDENLKKTSYVDLKYQKEGNLWWKKDNTDLPPIPSGSDEDYQNELDAWARKYGVSNVANASNKQKILDMPVKVPVTDVNGQTFLLNDKGTTVKQVMQDLIFIQHLKPYIEKMDKKFDELTVGADGSEILNYGTEREIYSLAESHAVELDRYLDSRSGKGKSSIFLSVAAPLMYNTLISTITKGQGEMEGKFIRTFADATVKENALQNHIKSISGTTDYNTYKQGLSDVKNYIKFGKEIYKISTGGVSSSTAKLGADMFKMYLEDSVIGEKSKTLNMLSETWSEFMTSKSCAQMSMFLGSSLGYFPYVVDLHTKLSKKVSDTAKAWYFVADYCIAPRYPELIERVMDEDYLLDKDYDYRWDIVDNGTPDNDIAKNWLYQANHTRAALINTDYIISTRRDMTNAASFFSFAKTVDVVEVKKSLLNYISAELNKGKTTEVYGKCPIAINIYDKDNILVATLSSDNENDINTEYGSFYLLGDDNNTKYFILSSDEYRMEIVPYDEGTMTVAITQKDENGEVLANTYYENVSISANEVYSADLSLDKPVLMKESEELEENISEVESVVVYCPEHTVAVGAQLRLTAIIQPDYTEDKSVVWSVDNESIATIDQDGCLTCVSTGTVNVTAIASNGVSASEKIEVYTPVSSIDCDYTEIAMVVGEKYTTEISVMPDDAALRKINWTSSDLTVATVDEGGEITANKAGEAIITAEADGAVKEFYITVSENIFKIRLEQSDIDGDKVKIDVQNMSCVSDVINTMYIGIYENSRLKSFIPYLVELAKQQKITDYFDVELSETNYKVKVFMWADNFIPLQKSEKIDMIVHAVE